MPRATRVRSEVSSSSGWAAMTRRRRWPSRRARARSTAAMPPVVAGWSAGGAVPARAGTGRRAGRARAARTSALSAARASFAGRVIFMGSLGLRRRRRGVPGGTGRRWTGWQSSRLSGGPDAARSLLRQVLQVAMTPGADGLHQRQERSPVVGQRVVDRRRGRAPRLPLDDAVLDELAQLLGEDLLRDAGHLAAQSCEVPRRLRQP